MPTREQLKKVSESYFQGLRDKNFPAIPFSDDIIFRAPLAPGGSGNPIKGKKRMDTLPDRDQSSQRRYYTSLHIPAVFN